jgi:ubiquinone/menaquinone biosynthesis C-methylase UbiE
MNGQSWSNVADEYFRYMEITTVQYVEQALDFDNLHSKSGIKILDVACGTGAVPDVISKRLSPDVSVLATDYAQGMVDAVNNRAEKEGWKNVKAQVMDATDLTLADASVDVVTCSFGMMFIPEAPKALSEFHRVLTPGGQAILITWLEQDLQELLLAVIAKAQGQKLPEIPWTHTW